MSRIQKSLLSFLIAPVLISLSMTVSVIDGFITSPTTQHPSVHRKAVSLFLQPEESTDIPPKTSNIRSSSNPRNAQRSVVSRREAFQLSIPSAILIGLLQSSETANAIPPQKSYSKNARNLDRLSAGDASGGSVYNNSPSSAAGAKRRAMLGCKIDVSRKEAMKMEGMNSLNEKDCNLKVMGGDTEFMLKALRELDCPTCPYGIKGA